MVHIPKKLEQLHSILLDYGRVAVAFSGGVDSSLLVKCALDSLGAGNVLILFGSSSLLVSEDEQRVQEWLPAHGYTKGVELQIVDLQPLSWKEFCVNSEERCYQCKLRMYKRFKEVMEKKGFSLLLDGTNTDDLKNNRPGIRAINQLGVKIPLVEAGLDKAAVRKCSRHLELTTWQLPSASCLATRIPHGLPVTEERLRTIEQFERGVLQFGLSQCRVRLDKDSPKTVYVQLSEQDLTAVMNQDIRVAMVRFFHNNGIQNVYLNMVGRH
ncbi:MAG: adenine nucleotide alpha hydrolase [Desulfobulbus propionicus]|nr:MAG: adenine nucleotide alpha hydrolase [Desulfobulbus propionicus]PIE66460.1 MAG: adenine nucleotide alpha hydrolase [Desulfobacterales bacterium]